MTTWHQNQNQDAIKAAYKPDPIKWKVVSDKKGNFLTVMKFDSYDAAWKHFCNCNGIIISPEKIDG